MKHNARRQTSPVARRRQLRQPVRMPPATPAAQSALAEDAAASFSGFPQENPNPVFQISQAGRLLYANPASQPLLAEWGWSVGQVVPRDWQERIASALDSGSDQEVEMQAAGRILSLNVHPVLGPAGHVNVYGHDITERKRAEAALRDSQERLATIIDTASEAILSTDEQQRILLFNKAAEIIFGYRSDEVLGQPLSILLPHRFSEIHSRHMQAFRVVPERTHTMGGPRLVVGRRKDGTEFSLQAGISKSGSGGPVTFTFIGADATQRQRAEEALLNSEKRFRALIENGLDNISLLAADGSLLWESPAVIRTLGYLPDEFVGRNAFELMHPDDFDWTKNILAELFREPASRQYGSFRLRRSDGTWRWVEAVATNLLSEPSVNAIVLNYRDVTERRQAEEALRASEARYRSLFDDSPIALWEEDYSLVKQRLDTLRQQGITDFRSYFETHPAVVAECAALIKVLDVNQAALKLHRASSKDELLRGLSGVFGPESYQALLSELVNVAQGNTDMQWERPTRTLAGAPLYASLHWSTLPGHEETLSRVIISSIDITERRRAEEALAQERNLLRTLIDNLPDAVYVKDRESRFVIKNLADARKMGAATPDETVGKTDLDYYPPELAARYRADDRAVIESGQAIVNREEPIKEATGRTGWVSTTKVPLRDQQGNVIGLVGIGHDITESKRAEEESQRRLVELEAVNRVSTAMRAAQTLDELLNEWLEVTLGVTNASGGSVWLYDRARDELQPKQQRGWAELAGTEPVRPLRPGEGINGQVFMTGQPYTSSNFRDDTRTAKALRERIPPGGGVCIPIRAGDAVIGTFVLYLPPPRQVTAAEAQLITTLSEIGGTAIQRILLQQQTERRLQNLVALREIDQTINSGFDLQLSLSRLLSHGVAQLGVDAADVLLYNPSLLLLEYSAGLGFRTQAFNHTQIRLGEGYAGRAALERSLVHVPNLMALSDNPRIARGAAAESFVSYFAVPLIAKGVIKGVLEVFRRAPLEADGEWMDMLNTLASQGAIAIDNNTLFKGLQRSNTELALAYDATIEGWSHALDLREKEMEGHTQRVAEATVRLALAMGLHEDELTSIRWGALLHDIGKMGVPDSILLKPGSLTDDEWVVVKKHPTLAYEMLAPIQYLRSALDIPYCHHEKWDGTGYPRGLAGEGIPQSARIFAAVDVWDALMSDRPYRAAWPEDKVFEYIRAQAGTHFDPEIVTVALNSGVLVRRERD